MRIINSADVNSAFVGDHRREGTQGSRSGNRQPRACVLVSRSNFHPWRLTGRDFMSSYSAVLFKWESWKLRVAKVIQLSGGWKEKGGEWKEEGREGVVGARIEEEREVRQTAGRRRKEFKGRSAWRAVCVYR